MTEEQRKAKDRERSRRRYAANPEIWKARTAKYHKDHPEVSRRANRKHYHGNLDKERESASARFNNLSQETRLKYSLYRFNISTEQYEELLNRQNVACAICGRSADDNCGRRLAVDHDHNCCSERDKSCGKCVRGLLCIRCNMALGYLQDSPEIARKAAAYLEGN